MQQTYCVTIGILTLMVFAQCFMFRQLRKCCRRGIVRVFPKCGNDWIPIWCADLLARHFYSRMVLKLLLYSKRVRTMPDHQTK